MKQRTLLSRALVLCLLAVLVTACSQTVTTPIESAHAAPPRKAAEATAPKIIVHRDAYCGCCHRWVEHLRGHGFDVDDRIEDDMGAVKKRLDIAPEHASCHTAEIGGYVVEGHVPASDIRRLLKERPRIHGIVLPGMPIGSPGMEVEGIDAKEYTVLALGHDGTTSTYTRHGP